MLGLEKVADWWEGNKKESEGALQEWVNTSESDFGLYSRAFVATSVSTAMSLGSGLVDVLRLGEGVKEGGWGYAKDALRVLAIAGPIFKLGRLGAAKWTFNPKGGLCASAATAKALRHTGNKMFLSAQSVFARSGSAAPKNLNEFVPMLKIWGVKVNELKLANLGELSKLLQKSKKSVVMFAVRWKIPNTEKGAAHALYAFRNSAGQLRIADRTGAIVDSLSKLEKFYPGISNAVPQGAALLIKNSIVTKGTSLASMLAIEVNALLVRDSQGNKEVQISPVKDN